MEFKDKVAALFRPRSTPVSVPEPESNIIQFPQNRVAQSVLERYEVSGMTSADADLLRNQLEKGVFAPIPQIEKTVSSMFQELKSCVVTYQARVTTIANLPAQLAGEVASDDSTVATYRIEQLKGGERLGLNDSSYHMNLIPGRVIIGQNSLQMAEFNKGLIKAEAEGEGVNVVTIAFYKKQPSAAVIEPQPQVSDKFGIFNLDKAA